MKKTGLLLLLVPTLFLASCQTTPKIDTITEKEAREFIEEHFTTTTFNVAPKDTSIIKWKINSTDETIKNEIKAVIGGYINGTITDDKNDKGLQITDATRLNKYLSELTDESVQFGDAPYDAVIGMNTAIFNKLYHSGQNDVDPFTLVYKPAGKGLVIISQSTMQNTTHTRTHRYNENGQETRFEVNVNKESGAYSYTMSIDFKYSK